MYTHVFTYSFQTELFLRAHVTRAFLANDSRCYISHITSIGACTSSAAINNEYRNSVEYVRLVRHTGRYVTGSSFRRRVNDHRKRSERKPFVSKVTFTGGVSSMRPKCRARFQTAVTILLLLFSIPKPTAFVELTRRRVLGDSTRINAVPLNDDRYRFPVKTAYVPVRNNNIKRSGARPPFVYA